MNLSRSLRVLRSPLGLALQSSASRPSAGLHIASAKRSLLPAGDQLGVATLFRRSIAVETPFKPEQPKPARKEFAHTIDTKALEAIDVGLQQHHVPRGVADRIALAIVKTLRMPTDIFFKKKYIHRAVMLETVAAVPGMVAAMLRHLKSLRRMKHDGGWIHHLLVEAENERMHLLTWMKITQPKPWERLLVLTVQGVFFNAYFLGYLLSPRTAHRMVGYLEEEAVKSYTAFLEEIDNGHIANTPAPEIAKVYWNLAPNATLRDVVLAVRADEAQHRDVNHHLSDRILAKSEDLRVPLQQ